MTGDHSLRDAYHKHVKFQIEELKAAGVAPKEALRQARESFLEREKRFYFLLWLASNVYWLLTLRWKDHPIRVDAYRKMSESERSRRRI